MAAQGNLVYPDAAATPVNHTFKPMGQLPQQPLFLWQDQAPADPVGFPSMLFGMRRPNGSNRNYKTWGSLAWPVLEIVGTAGYGAYQAPPKIAHSLIFRWEAVISERASLQARKDFQKIAGQMVYGGAGSPVYDGIVALEGVW